MRTTDGASDGDVETVMWRERLTVSVSNSVRPIERSLSSTDRSANTDDTADKTALALSSRSFCSRGSAHSVETLGVVVIDNWIQSSTNAAAAAAAAAATGSTSVCIVHHSAVITTARQTNPLTLHLGVIIQHLYSVFVSLADATIKQLTE